jgi:hypothetical protein
MKSRKVFRNDRVHVCGRMCDTCIFRPANLMYLEECRLENMVREATRNESCITCHETLSGYQAVCRGFYDRHATAPLQIAERLGCIVFQAPPAKSPHDQTTENTPCAFIQRH